MVGDLRHAAQVATAVRRSTSFPGDVVVTPFAWSDGTCVFCQEGLPTSCLHGGWWGGTDLDGGQGEAVRVPQADGTLVVLPVGEDDALMPSLLTLSDVMGTGHHAALAARVAPGKTAAVVGDGAVGPATPILECHLLAVDCSRGEEDVRVSRRGWLLFGAMCVIWGIPYLLIKVAVGELAPATLVLVRTSLAALLLLPVAFARGQLLPLLRRWWWLLVYTVVEICVPWLLLGFAEQRLSSSLTGLLVAAVPLVGAVLARYGGEHDPLGRRRLLGLLTGLAGVAALVGFEVGAGDIRAIAGVAVVAVAYAAGPVILARRLADLPALGVVAASLGLAALAYLPAGVAQAPERWPSARVVAAVLVLAVVCTALAFLLFFRLIAEVGPARSVVITYVNPAIAVLLGVLLLGERFTVATGVGFVLILVGSMLATGRPTARPAEPGPASKIECAAVAQPVAEP